MSELIPSCIMAPSAAHVFSMSARCAASAFHSGVLDTPVASSSATCSGCMNRHVYTQQQRVICPLIMHRSNPGKCRCHGSQRHRQGLVCTEQLDGQQATTAAATTHRLGWRRCDGGGHDDAAVRPPAAAVPAGRLASLAHTVGRGHCKRVRMMLCACFQPGSSMHMVFQGEPAQHAECARKTRCPALVRRMDVLVDAMSPEATSNCQSCSC